MKYFDVNCSFLVGLDDMMDGKDPPTHPSIVSFIGCTAAVHPHTFNCGVVL